MTLRGVVTTLVLVGVVGFLVYAFAPDVGAKVVDASTPGPRKASDTCPVRSKTLSVTTEWADLNTGNCIVVYEKLGDLEGEDIKGPFPLGGDGALTRNPDRVRAKSGTGKIKYSLCDMYLAGQLLNYDCSVRRIAAR